jgi:hypothetical protein
MEKYGRSYLSMSVIVLGKRFQWVKDASEKWKKHFDGSIEILTRKPLMKRRPKNENMNYFGVKIKQKKSSNQKLFIIIVEKQSILLWKN